MVTIYLTSDNDEREPWFFEGSIADLFRTVRVAGEVAFVEVSPGSLINIACIERIVEEQL